MLVSSILRTDMRMTLPAFHGLTAMECGAVYSTNLARTAAFSRSDVPAFFRNNLKPSLASLLLYCGWVRRALAVHHGSDSAIGCDAALALATRRDD